VRSVTLRLLLPVSAAIVPGREYRPSISWHANHARTKNAVAVDHTAMEIVQLVIMAQPVTMPAARVVRIEYPASFLSMVSFSIIDSQAFYQSGVLVSAVVR
jgi:hypothetical protein